MKNKLAVILTIAVLFFAAFFLRNNYGANYNPTRNKLGIPPVGKNWSLKRQNFLSELVYSNNSIKGPRYHLRKTVKVDFFNNVTEEYDYYIVEDKQIAIDVIYDYSKTQHWFIRYYDNSSEKPLSRTQLSDTLSKYKLE